ncbi:MAG TPA: hypothetical protein VFE98_06295 [Candidatus Bathyarchaeia archaeon]|nr:hypothetical protein [Candidatus Bathyarchaeia archaeon]
MSLKARLTGSAKSGKDGPADLFLAIGVGFLINLMLGVAIPEIGAFVAGLVSGVIVKAGPSKGAIAGFLAGSLGGLASVGLWVATNLISMPGPLLSVAFTTAVGIVTATSAIMSLSGGIIGSVVSLQQWPRMTRFLSRYNISFPFHMHRSSAAMRTKEE